MPTSVDLSNPSDNKQFGEFNDFLLSKNKFSPEEIKKQAKELNLNKSNFNNLNSNDLSGKTSLHRFMKEAAGDNITKENIECLKELGANFNSLDARHQDPLSSYLSRNDVNLDIFKFIVSKEIGAEIFITEGTEYKKFNHLHTYLLSKKNEISIDILRYFKEELKADFNCATRGNFKVPHLLCIYNSKKITKEILSYLKGEAEVDFNALDGSNKNIAHYYLNSCEEPNQEIVKTLGEFGVGFTQKDTHDSNTPLHYYMKQANEISLPILKLIIDNNKDLVATKNGGGKTPLHYYAEKDDLDVEVINFLSGAGDNILNAKDNEGKTFLHHYFINHNKPNKVILEKLVELKVDFTQKDNQNWTALHFYLQKAVPDEGVLNILKEQTKDINAVNKNQATPMDIALHRNNIMREIKNEDIEFLEKLGFKKQSELPSSVPAGEDPADSKNYSFFEYVKNVFSSFFGIFPSKNASANSENVELNYIENNPPESKSLLQKFSDIFSACTSFIFPSWNQKPEDSDLAGNDGNNNDVIGDN